MSRDGLQPNPEEQGLERPVACPTAKWASSPALCPNGREFDPSEPSSQHQTRPEVELPPKMQAERPKAEQHRRRRRHQRLCHRIASPIFVMGFIRLEHGTSGAAVGFFSHRVMQAAAARRRRMQSR